MSDHSKTQSSTRQKLSPSIIGAVMGIIAVLAPIVISVSNYGWGEVSTMIIAMTWQASYSPWGPGYYAFNPFMLLSTLPLTFLRIVFLVMMVRLYQGKTTKKRAILVGFACELQLVALFYGSMLLAMLLSPYPFELYQIMIPIPILFFIGLLITKFVPPTEVTTWIEEEKTDSWWERQDEKSPATPGSSKEKTKKAKEPDSPW